jgi:hypothetical protein
MAKKAESKYEEFTCPITREIMTDPVIDREGNTYERDAITEWIKLHGTSPITRNYLSTYDLAPNRALREAIEAKDAKGEKSTSSSSAQSHKLKIDREV